MAMNVPIINHMQFFYKTLICFISPNNEGICLKFLQHTNDHTLTFKTFNTIERSRFKVTPRIHCFSKVLLYLTN